MSSVGLAGPELPAARKRPRWEFSAFVGRGPRARTGFAELLLTLGVVLLFTISPSVLYRLGIHYEAPGGNPLGKFHPGTLVSLAAFAVLLVREGTNRALGGFATRSPGAAAFAMIWVFAIAYIATTLKLPVSPVLETFLLPLVLFAAIAIRGAAPPELTWIIHAAFLANAVIGLGEFVTGHRLTPLMAATIEIKGDWRSSALLGHPLINANMTAAYIAILVFRGGSLGGALRAAMLALQTLALVVFGGRAALVLTVLLLTGVGLVRLFGFFGGRRVRLLSVATFVLALPAAALVLGILVEHGFFDLLIERFISDEGSAQTRVAMLRLFAALSTQDVLFGPDPALIETIVQREGLEFGIESFPVAFVLLYGAILTGFFFAGLGAFCIDLVRATRPAAAMVLALFFLIAATSLSLAGKTTILGLATIMLLTLMGPEHSPVRLPATRKAAP